MKVVVGLGNPGEKYEWTRHNAGFLVLDRLCEDLGGEFRREMKFMANTFKKKDLILGKPITFMNKSGESVSKLVNYFNVSLDDLIVVHDDLDITLGEFKLQKGKGPKVHNGVNSIEEQLGEIDFWRVRVGVDNRDNFGFPGNGADYVLGRFGKGEREILNGVVDQVVEELKEILV